MTVEGGSDRDRLVMEHVPLLRYVVGRMNLPKDLDRDDILGWGMLGLISAAEGFDPARGVAFSTYAHSRIRGAILDELRRTDALPRSRRALVRKLEQTISDLTQESGCPPTQEEIAQRAQVTLEELEEAMTLARTRIELSLEDESPEGSLAAMLSDPTSDDPVASVQHQEMKQLLEEAIQGLPAPERTAVLLYYGEEMLLRDIAGVMGVTESRVSQIHASAIYRLNRELTLAYGGNPR